MTNCKETLRKTIRGLRTKLIEDLSDAAKSEYRLDLAAGKAKLPEGRRRRRERLEAWLDEQVRAEGKTKAKPSDLRQRHFHQAAKEAAHTLINRLVFLRILEHHGVIEPAVVSGGWASPAYEQEFVHYAGPLAEDDTRGYQTLLEVVFSELAIELPGLFGPVGLTQLFPVPASTLREVVEAINDPALEEVWGDDTTLGWVYQYWNDPERESLDAKIAGGGKIEPHEIASKTQMFTERYMVEWLLQNSLGLTWLCICRKNGWTAEAEVHHGDTEARSRGREGEREDWGLVRKDDGAGERGQGEDRLRVRNEVGRTASTNPNQQQTLSSGSVSPCLRGEPPSASGVLLRLDERRAAWRKKREAGEVALDALMPVDEGLENAWKYYVPQPIPQDGVDKAPSSIREVKLLDPACGSGHFLVIAFDLLAKMYEEEARHRGQTWTRAEIARGILQDNLHGIDIDGRAVQIAAAALWLKAKLYARDATLGRMNLVAPSFRLGSLPKEDPALVGLVGGMDALGVPSSVTYKLVESLSGVDYLGSLLRVDQAINDLLDDVEREDGPLFVHATRKQRAALEERLAEFLDAHAAEADLGLRLGGEQLAAGLRFVRLVKEGTYDVVVGNPPYQGLSKTSQFEYVTKNYPRGKADLYAAFLERGLELARDGGISALLTMRGWMFLGQFTTLREYLVGHKDLRLLGDLDRGAFADVPDEVLATVISVIRRADPGGALAVAVQPTPLDDRSRDSQRTARKRAGLLAQVGRHEFDPKGFEVIEGEPIVYWWSKKFLERYAAAPKLGQLFAARAGMATQDNPRFLRRPWECSFGIVRGKARDRRTEHWQPYIKGAAGREWFEALLDLVRWEADGLQISLNAETKYGSVSRIVQSRGYYFSRGVAFTNIGNTFAARAHRYPSIFSNMGSSVFPGEAQLAEIVCLMNCRRTRDILQSLNPGVHFEVRDVARLPIFPVANADDIFATIEQAFTEHESHREPSVEFKKPGPSPWRYAQDWAQRAVDRPEGAPLPPYEPEYDPPDPEAERSFAVGVALGRFGANGEGILDPNTTTTPSLSPSAPWLRGSVVSSGILFVSPSDPSELRDWLRKDFFPYHKALYENRPIYFPLSSEKRSFVAWVSIHRWADDTLQVLLADHLHPALREIDGEIDDLNRSRASSDKKTAAAAEKRYNTVKKLRDELAAFVDAVTVCAERGAPPTDPGCPPREVDATFHMDLDDGVMINSAALWPLLDPQWKDPKKWWKQLCEAKGKKDYDWSHLARRYFPTRVDAKCRQDPSLGVAHGCFWRYHPAKAYAWELRLKDEIRPDFTIDEADSEECRARFLAEHADEAQAIWDKEMVRRERKKAKQGEEDAPVDGEVGEESETEGEDE